MSKLSVLGVDPGTVHNGLVRMEFDPAVKTFVIDSRVIPGISHDDGEFSSGETAKAIGAAAREMAPDHIFIEAFRERGNSFKQDGPMRDLLRELRREIPKGQVIDNTGVKKVVLPSLMKRLGLIDFPTTHHRDLESAARIGVYGVLKDSGLNQLLSNMLFDALEGRPWTIKRSHSA